MICSKELKRSKCELHFKKLKFVHHLIQYWNHTLEEATNSRCYFQSSDSYFFMTATELLEGDHFYPRFDLFTLAGTNEI